MTLLPSVSPPTDLVTGGKWVNRWNYRKTDTKRIWVPVLPLLSQTVRRGAGLIPLSTSYPICQMIPVQLSWESAVDDGYKVELCLPNSVQGVW